MRIEGFAIGVYVAASNVVVKNVDGATNPKGTSFPVYVVELDTGATNVALMGISNNCSQNCGSAYSVKDVPENATLLKDQFVAIYALGVALPGTTSNVYSRFTTSPAVANWSVGSSSASGACTAKGSLYSNTAPSSGNPALYVCSAFNGQWEAVK